MIALLHHWRRCDKGVSAVEFALVVPVMLLMMVGLTDFGLAVNEKMRLINAVRAGAQAGYGNSTNTAAITQAVKDASGLNAAAITVTVASSCGCADGSSAACGGTCADASSVRTYVTVTVTESYALMISYPGFTNPMTLSASAALRVN